MTSVTVEVARQRAAQKMKSQRRYWATVDSEPVFEVPLHPPNERQTLADMRAAQDWANTWRDLPGVEITWVLKHWPSVGTQKIPERLTITGADAIADFVGGVTAREWRLLKGRVCALRNTFDDTEDLKNAIQSNSAVLIKLSEPDAELLLQVLGWLAVNPASGYRLRQVPIPGMHTKWLKGHRSLVENLYKAITGREGLGLTVNPALARMRFLDPTTRPGGLADVTAPLDQLAELQPRVRGVIIVENLETLLTLPNWPGVAAIAGGGYSVTDMVAQLPWVRELPIVYWGDLDADGLKILNRLRGHGYSVTSALMDEETYLRFRHLWVSDLGFSGKHELHQLDLTERKTYERIVVEGGQRLECPEQVVVRAVHEEAVVFDQQRPAQLRGRTLDITNLRTRATSSARA